MSTAALEAVVADALELCAIAAPTFAEQARALEVARRLTLAGAPPSRDDVGNVLVRFGPGDGPAAIVTAHLDTVFAAGTPLAPRRDGDVLRGPGIGDDALALAALLHLARRLVAAPAPRHPVVLAATVGEEGLGDLRGAKALLGAVDCDAFVALEGHGIDVLRTAGIASARLRVRVTGPGGHSWADHGLPSAVHALLKACTAAVAAARGGHLNVGVMGGGTSVNTIAADAEAELDLRDADDAVLARRVEAVRAALRAGPFAPGIEVAVEQVGARPGGATAPHHPLLRAARKARAAAGLAPAQEVASSTDANAALGRGVPAVCVALTRGTGAHRLDESVELAPLAGGLAAVEALVDALGAGLPGA